VGFEDTAQFVDFFDGHALGGQTTGHAFEGFADFIEFEQLGMAQRHHPRADVRHAHQQALAFEAMDRFAQRPTADAIGTRQLRLGDLAARGDLTFDDGRLDASENVLGECFRIVLRNDRGIELIQHIVDTLKANAAKTSEYRPNSQRINRYCRQSSNNRPHHNEAAQRFIAPCQRWRHKTTVLECRPHLLVICICTACHK